MLLSLSGSREVFDHRPIRLMGAAIVVTGLAFGYLSWMAYHSYQSTSREVDRVLRIEELHGTIMRLDEVLTMSARMAAWSGNLSWETRYLQQEGPLDQAIKEVMRLVPEVQGYQGAAQTDEANLKLVAMEKEAFRWVRRGDFSHARRVMDSTSYREQKQVYAGGMAEFSQLLRRVAQDIRAVQRQRWIWSVGMVAVAFPLLLMGWWWIWQAIRRGQAELVKANVDLDHKVDERTQDLHQALEELRRTQAQMVQSSKMAAVGQLAGGVAHEINNPLGVILGFAQVLEQRVSASDPLRLPVTSIVREATRCKNLVKELLTFSRTGGPGQKAEALEMAALIRDTVPLLEAKAKTQGVTVLQESAEGLPPLTGHFTQLQQILVNLGVNALDAMPSGGTLTFRAAREGEKTILLKITDTGTGIPPEIQAKIFDPFFTTKEVGQGTGLGLSLVHELVQQHGGTIGVDSEIGKGTTFSVRLPIAHGEKGGAS